MRSVAVVGAAGYVGRALHAALLEDTANQVVGVTRSDYASRRSDSFDVLINCAMPSGRFWARQHPEEDFAETVQKTADLVYGWSFGKLVQVSTLSARCQLHTIYGRHKAAAEKLCRPDQDLVVRLGPMYSPDLSKGVLVDLLNDRPVFAAAQSRYCFAPLDFVCAWIASNLERSGLVEVGARNAVSLAEVAAHIGAKSEFQGAVDDQEVERLEPDFPDAAGVLAFVGSMRRARARS
jgi:nucleoside-diphosphate-sugar epimerase